MILKIAITGGPGAGKTSCFEFLKQNKDKFIKQGFIPLFVPEAATYLLENELTARNDIISFQTDITKFQINKENEMINKYTKYPKDESLPNNNVKSPPSKQNYIMFCDRGIMDGKAFLGKELFDKVLNNVNIKEDEIFPRYDYVIHLISPARECPENYTLKTNKNRTENLKEAGEIDIKTEYVWEEHPGYVQITNASGVPGKYKDVLDFALDLIKKQKE